MLSEERRRAIQQLLSAQKRVLVDDLVRKFGVSPVTIRKDLKILERQGILTKVHGGAILNQALIPDLALTEKERLQAKEKQRIARRAADLVKEGDVIILDSGSTTTFIARYLKLKEGLTIITSAVNIATELAASRNEVILTGGFLQERSFSLVGPLAEDAIRRMTADRLFLATNGIDFDVGLTTPSVLEAKVNQLMIRAAAEVIVVADSTKFGRRSMAVICDVADVDRIITDKNVKPECVEKMKLLGVDVILV